MTTAPRGPNARKGDAPDGSAVDHVQIDDIGLRKPEMSPGERRRAEVIDEAIRIASEAALGLGMKVIRRHGRLYFVNQDNDKSVEITDSGQVFTIALNRIKQLV